MLLLPKGKAIASTVEGRRQIPHSRGGGWETLEKIFAMVTLLSRLHSEATAIAMQDKLWLILLTTMFEYSYLPQYILICNLFNFLLCKSSKPQQHDCDLERMDWIFRGRCLVTIRNLF